jgi:DNA polymerase type B, organellar and viral
VTRFWHYIKRNARNESVSNMVVFDTETTPELLPDGDERDRLTFGWASYEKKDRRSRWTRPQWLRFESKETFWEWVDGKTREKTALYCFCHNTNFDLAVLDAFHELVRLGWEIVFAVIDGPPTMVRLKKGHRVIWLLDTLNFWRVPLQKVGEMIGLPKLEMPPADAPRKEWDRYAKRDVEILRVALHGWFEFLQTEDMGCFKRTLAGQAMGTYRHKYMHYQILVHCNPTALKMERAAYHGGRCECFYLGRATGEFFLLDVNSMYPAVMHDCLYPRRLICATTRYTAERIYQLTRVRCVIVDCDLETDEPVYPLVQDDKLIFPTGSFRTCLTTQEFRYAWEHGHVKQVHCAAFYVAEPLFRDFMGEMHKRKQAAKDAGNAPLSYQFKILMNAFYGKWGQAGRVWQKDRLTDDHRARVWYEMDFDTKKVKYFRQFAGLVQSYRDEEESAESCPAIAAEITANARMLLWRLMQQAGRENVYYCDTDSLLVNRAGYERLSAELQPEEMGKLAVEHTCQDIEIWGPKDYRFGTKERHKGVRKNAVWLDAQTVEQVQWSSLTGLLRLGDLSGPRRRKIVKHLSRDYTKGVKDETNWITPLRIDSYARVVRVVGVAVASRTAVSIPIPVPVDSMAAFR